jgi:hypothetical protein
MAQDPAAPEDPAPDEAPADITGQQFEKKERHFGLYVGVAAGSGSSNTLGTSIAAGPLDAALSSVELTDQIYGRSAIGWQRKDVRKGDFRLVVQGLREEAYEFSSSGVSNRVASGDDADLNCELNTGQGDTEKDCLVRWWEVNASSGNFTAVRLRPMWDLAADAAFGDGDGQPDFGTCIDLGGGLERCGEITYDRNAPDRVIEGQIADDLQNRIQSYDALYGREFGGRRFSSRWWTGLRYFVYEGQMLSGAWLNSPATAGGSAPGEHFTDGSFLKLLHIAQETTGFGPTGSWEADFNFFDRGVVLYLRGEVAFTFNTMKIDSGAFFRVAQESTSQNPATLVNDRMTKELDKSTWQNKAEAGARVNFKNGLQLEVGYSRTGYLDIIMMPDLLQLGGPQVTNENPQIFTQDLIVDAFHAGVGFQF